MSDERPAEVPDDARTAAYAARYGEPVDTYTWDCVVNAALAVAAPIIRADERRRVADEAEELAEVMPKPTGVLVDPEDLRIALESDGLLPDPVYDRLCAAAGMPS